MRRESSRGRRGWVGLGTVLVLGILAAAPSWAAVLGNPGNGRLYSGIGVISGWKCEADGDLTIVFNDDGKHIPLVYGTERTDVRKNGQCLDNTHDNVGFVAIWNWAILGDGEHTAIVYDNGVAFDRATFTVGSTGEEFLKGAMRQHLLENFPVTGETTILEWNESTQHFEIRGMLDSPLGGEYDLAYWRQMSIDLAVGTYRTAEFLYTEEPDLDACEAGELTQAAKDRALEAMNQIRALHHLPPVQYSRRYDEQMQQAALIHAIPGGRGHFPRRALSATPRRAQEAADRVTYGSCPETQTRPRISSAGPMTRRTRRWSRRQGIGGGCSILSRPI